MNSTAQQLLLALVAINLYMSPEAKWKICFRLLHEYLNQTFQSKPGGCRGQFIAYRISCKVGSKLGSVLLSEEQTLYSEVRNCA